MKKVDLKKLLVGLAILSVIGMASINRVNAQTVHHVKAGGTGSGTSWSDASGDLQEMINIASAGDQVWVAAGTYKPFRTAENWNSKTKTYPTKDGGRNNAFVLKADVPVYGGFAGTETGLDDRNRTANPTILSGVIGSTGTAADSVYHVVICGEAKGTSYLDGFTITGGNANGPGKLVLNKKKIPRDTGGGIYNSSALALSNLTVSGNQSSSGGGGIYNSSTLALSNVTVSGNQSSGEGGGIVSFGKLTLTNVTVSDNTAKDGGGIYGRLALLTNVTVSRNRASRNGGGIWNFLDLTLTNVTVSGNQAGHDGGGIWTYINLTLTNITVSGNTASKHGGGIWSNSVIKLNNSIVWGNRAEKSEAVYTNARAIGINYSIISINEGFESVSENMKTNLDVDPLFVSPSTGDYRLQAGSPAIDSGDNAAYLRARGELGDFTGETDPDGNPRLSGTSIDRGAYEYQQVAPIITTDSIPAGAGQETEL